MKDTNKRGMEARLIYAVPPAAPAPAAPVPDALVEAVAKAIYWEWRRDAGYVPWVDGGNSFKQDDARKIARAVVSSVAPVVPIDMVLHCPKCGLQHIDAPDERTHGWRNEPHRSHLCHGCGHIWRPADVPTNGVAAVATKGKADSPIAAMIAQLQATPVQAGTTIYIEEETFDLAPGEHYAGAVLDANGQHMHHLVLMAAKPEGDLTWKAALEWAEEVGGALPTRQEQALLFANCKPHLTPRWHWSCEENETDASCAWGCYFCYGTQNVTLKSFEGSAVAVRYIKIGASK